MEKTATLNLRINPEVKENAEQVLCKLGIPMSTAINIYLKQIVLTGGIPFRVALPDFPESINAAAMRDKQLYKKISDSYTDVEENRVYKAAEAFAEFRKSKK